MTKSQPTLSKHHICLFTLVVADLFNESKSPEASSHTTLHDDSPLAARLRPRNLSEYVGQQHILGEGKLLRRAVVADRFNSLIFHGPPGVGKTTLAHLIAHQTESRFVNLSGVESNVAQVRAAIEEAAVRRKLHNTTTILFVDEIHRFNKSQQDVLLPHIERGTIRFIGATTHNPFFYINSPLVSRSMLFELEPIPTDELIRLVHHAISDSERGFGGQGITISDEAAAHIARQSDGDARKCLTALELAVLTSDRQLADPMEITLEIAQESVQKKAIVYDGNGDAHHDTISAFIKSIRGSDPDAALYWLAKMIVAGEDPRFIARRLVISASEDIGMADSNGLRVAMASFDAVEKIGMPEARINLAHATVYLATAPKSNRAYAAIDAAIADVKNGATLAVPPHLRTKSRKASAERTGHISAKDLNYTYAHDSENGYIPQAYLPEGKRYYEPSSNGLEKRVKERLDHLRALFEAAQNNK